MKVTSVARSLLSSGGGTGQAVREGTGPDVGFSRALDSADEGRWEDVWIKQS